MSSAIGQPINLNTANIANNFMFIYKEILMLNLFIKSVSNLKMDFLHGLYNLILYRLKDEIKSFEFVPPKIRQKAYKEQIMLLLELSAILKEIAFDREIENQHTNELVNIQKQLHGKSCPTCKQILNEKRLYENILYDSI